VIVLISNKNIDTIWTDSNLEGIIKHGIRPNPICISTDPRLSSQVTHRATGDVNLANQMVRLITHESKEPIRSDAHSIWIMKSCICSDSIGIRGVISESSDCAHLCCRDNNLSNEVTILISHNGEDIIRA
jgi:hypothetical protein